MIRKKVKIPSPIDYLSCKSLNNGKAETNYFFSLLLLKWKIHSLFPLQLGKLLTDEPIHSVFLVNEEETELLNLSSYYHLLFLRGELFNHCKQGKACRTENSITSCPYPIILLFLQRQGQA